MPAAPSVASLVSVGNFYPTRINGPILIGINHITAGRTDWVLPDTSAEGTLNWFRMKQSKVSIHGIVDSDTRADCLATSATAWHAAKYNGRSIGLEIGTGQVDWRKAPDAWVEAAIDNATEWWVPRVKEARLPLVKVTKAQVDRVYRNPNHTEPLGFIGHGELDPGNRADPGLVRENGKIIDTFPWSEFFSMLGAKMSTKVTPPLKGRTLTRADFDGVLGPNTIRGWQSWYVHYKRLPASAVDGAIWRPSPLITEVQRDLIRLGLLPKGEDDGYLGDRTWAALVKHFRGTDRKSAVQGLQLQLWKGGYLR